MAAVVIFKLCNVILGSMVLIELENEVVVEVIKTVARPLFIPH